MICIEGPSADFVWRQAIQELRTNGVFQESRDQATRELLHVAFTIKDPRQRLVYGRPINPAFAVAEVIGIMSGANDSNFLSFWNPRMMSFVDEDESKFHGAYGYRLGSQPELSNKLAQQLRREVNTDKDRLDQIKSAYEALCHIPHSRQIVLQIWDSKHDLPNPEPRSKDVPCNVMSHLMIRNGKLEWLQVMRSNDLMWGTPYNFIQFTTMQEIMAGWLGVEVGTYNHISASLHAYERHWYEVEAIETRNLEIPVNRACLGIKSYTEWEKLWARLVDIAVQLTKFVEAGDLLALANDSADMPKAYFEWIALLTAEALRRRGYLSEAKKMISYAGAFWATSWWLWTEEVSSRNNTLNKVYTSSCHEPTDPSFKQKQRK